MFGQYKGPVKDPAVWETVVTLSLLPCPVRRLQVSLYLGSRGIGVSKLRVGHGGLWPKKVGGAEALVSSVRCGHYSGDAGS